MRTQTFIFGLAAFCVPLAAMAGPVLQFPEGAIQSYQSISPVGTLKMPVGPYANGKIDRARVEGEISRLVWKTPANDTNTLDLMNPLRSQLKDAGYSVLFECATRNCGGFDFRFKTDVVAEPEMHVDLGDFRYLAASKRTKNGDEFIGLLVSRSPERGFIQVTNIGTPIEPVEKVSASTKNPFSEAAPVAPVVVTGVSDVLEQQGVVVLEGLEFQNGSADLSGDGSKSLQELAAFLTAHPKDAVVLVGHTDATGTLARNVALSRERAASVMKRLVETYGVSQGQISAEGVGYLSPRASNATDEGRRKNRRVEVVLTAVN
ncbi:MAG: OmpA family protein [Alphaproteobacteria bacterium]|nr:OmpA family protein [Alphaproteobacteria bacterium]